MGLYGAVMDMVTIAPGVAVADTVAALFKAGEVDGLTVDVGLTITNTPDGARCSSLTVFEGDGPITRAVLRSIPVRRLAAQVAQSQPTYRVDGTAAYAGAANTAALDAAHAAGRRRIPPSELARAADAYRYAKAEGRPVVEAVATAMHLSLRAAERWIRKARDAGLLEPVSAPQPAAPRAGTGDPSRP